MSKVIILGAGVIGITTAYYLNKAGFDVEVYDEHSGPAQGTSFANAGQISVGYSAPWAAPGVPLKALKWMFDSKAPFDFKFDKSLDQIKWVAKFLNNCNKESYTQNKNSMLNLSAYSQECLKQLRYETNIQYEGRQHGTLQLFRNEKQLDSVKNDIKLLDDVKIPYMIINNRQALIRLEPGLQHSSVDLIGGLWMPNDETGDCNLFCKNLESICKMNGVSFHYNTKIKSLWKQGNQIEGAIIDFGTTYGPYYVDADFVVIASGVYSKEMLKDVNIDIPVYPVRGHSLTIDINCSNYAPVSTILDETNKVAITRFDNRIRAGGFAELAGYTTKTKHDGWPRMMQLLELIEELFPDATSIETSKLSELREKGFWSGLRPMTPNGIPIIGETGLKNLYVNTGHGTLGWTMSCGSAKYCADLIASKTPVFSRTEFSIKK